MPESVWTMFDDNELEYRVKANETELFMPLVRHRYMDNHTSNRHKEFVGTGNREEAEDNYYMDLCEFFDMNKVSNLTNVN